ncbi:acyl-ACP--UDP-N-acetylglucosamine O-acyltransferase [bacterium]|nr:acyl-ACP--UDP-N-acetylglucosamine O-acyltransferase [bacterium]
MKIHETAIIDSKAEIGSGTSIGPYARVEGDVVIGKDCEIMQGAQILTGARIGDRCCFHQGTVISSLPQDKKFTGGRSFLKIGDDSVIREYATISRSTQPDGSTVIGKNAYIMTGVHIGHDCKISDSVTMANLVTLAGHVTVEKLATIGGMTVIHQFVRVGELAMVGGDSGLMMDAPPYMITFGYAPARVYGINSIGLRRNDIDEDTRMLLKRAYKLLFRSKHNFSQAVEIIRKEMPQSDTIKHLVEFFKNTKRGISVSANSMKMSGYHAHNGHSESHFDSLLEIVKDEKVVREIMSFLETKTGDTDGYAN